MAIEREMKQPTDALLAKVEEGSRLVSVGTTYTTMASMIATFLPEEGRPESPAMLAAIGSALADAYNAGWWACHGTRLF